MNSKRILVIPFKDLHIEDVPIVGGKNASLGEMYRELNKKGVTVPNGFAITALAYRYFIESAGLKDKIHKILSDLDTTSTRNLMKRGKKVRNLILKAELPLDLQKEIIENYKLLSKESKEDYTDVAVRSSATAEDLPDASFAGQQETYLNVRGEKELLKSCKKCFASLFTNRAISYRVDKGFDHFTIALSIGVQKMVRSDLSSSGVMFSIDTESGFKDAVFITSIYGLGENIVQGAVNPDEFYVHKPTLKKGYKSIISKKLGNKKIRMIYGLKYLKQVKNIPVSEDKQKEFSITDDEILKLAKMAITIEDHYKKAMDIEWAKDGKTNKLYIVQARPETVQSQRNVNILEEYVLKEKGKILSKGQSVGSRIGSGKVRVIKNVSGIHDFKKGEVLVTEMTDPDWEPIMKIASAIVTDKGGRTCHAAIISRELGIPCLVGTDDATKKLKNGDLVTVSCADGEEGRVYEGKLKYVIEKHNLEKLPKTKTKIMMNLGNPEQAFEQSFIPNDGVGLAREEFIINSHIKIHPNALIDYDKLSDKNIKKKIDDLTFGYKDKKQFYIDKLAEGIAMIAAAFYPKDVIVRMSDFKTNEYRNLIGGELYEPTEDNPMIGWRGASRYYKEAFRKSFELECKAIKKVRNQFGLKNVKVMIPFCRTIEEGKKVQEIMAKEGLSRGKDELEIYVMCEIPSNVILADEFSKIFDGFSIGSNDLTQLTLGVDRDSEIVSDVYDERNEAVKELISIMIKKAKKNKRKIGICGQAPSDFPDFAQFLVKEGIDSISLNPDTIIKTRIKIAEQEKKK
ncbi:MAG TPA: phosphoenolpyruvate synthase [Nanoarchaeota archaeon]|nr:phosphoenolpyruvate synthase [Nanoarchaeota archaeon]HIH63279.1 phosphoenolpyruvate synthase [Nanoarchaeota archaeon]HIJ09275.1 phosphoenolpyruvate synthase [Nanoarchaeota archaeon]